MPVIEIGTIEQLIAFGNGDYGLGTSEEPLTVSLTADLDFSTYQGGIYSWKGCTGQTGTSTSYYYGNFYGNGHKIDNIYYGNGPGPNGWRFINLGAGSVIQDLLIDNAYIIGGSGTNAGIAYGQPSYIKNCHFRGVMQASGGISGIFANASNPSTRIAQCSFSGTLYGTSSGNIRGITSNSRGVIINCNVVADVYSKSGTVYGISEGGDNVNCEFKGDVMCEQGGMYVFGGNPSVNCLGIFPDGLRSDCLKNTTNTYVNCGVTDAMASTSTYLGETTTSISDGSTTKTIKIDGVNVSVKNGDVALRSGAYLKFRGGVWRTINEETLPDNFLPETYNDGGIPPTFADLQTGSQWLQDHMFAFVVV